MVAGFIARQAARCFAILFVTVLAFGAYFAFLQLSGNFHAVIPGELYRSAQPSPAQLEYYAKAFGVKTVVNLRGRSDKRWYKDEIETAQRLNLTHIDFPMSAYRHLKPEDAEELVALMRDAPKPILIHCQAGADRTGLVSVLYSQQIAGIAEDTAERQLSLFFGHVGIPYLSRAVAMDESWLRLESHFGLKG